MAAGDLDKRVTLMRPIYNDIQDEIIDWEPVAEVWALVEPGFSQEINEAGRTVAIGTVTVTMRYRPDIDARWQIVDHEHTYQIRGMSDVARRRVQLQITCEEVS